MSVYRRAGVDHLTVAVVVVVVSINSVFGGLYDIVVTAMISNVEDNRAGVRGASPRHLPGW